MYVVLYVYSTTPSPPIKSFLLRVLESNFPGDSLEDYTDMRIPTPLN